MPHANDRKCHHYPVCYVANNRIVNNCWISIILIKYMCAVLQYYYFLYMYVISTIFSIYQTLCFFFYVCQCITGSMIESDNAKDKSTRLKGKCFISSVYHQLFVVSHSIEKSHRHDVDRLYINKYTIPNNSIAVIFSSSAM